MDAYRGEYRRSAPGTAQPKPSSGGHAIVFGPGLKAPQLLAADRGLDGGGGGGEVGGPDGSHLHARARGQGAVWALRQGTGLRPGRQKRLQAALGCWNAAAHPHLSAPGLPGCLRCRGPAPAAAPWPPLYRGPPGHCRCSRLRGAAGAAGGWWWVGGCARDGRPSRALLATARPAAQPLLATRASTQPASNPQPLAPVAATTLSRSRPPSACFCPRSRCCTMALRPSPSGSGT